jgi:hypothetical protein
MAVPVTLYEETPWGSGNFHHRSYGKSVRQKRTSLNNRHWFGKDYVHDVGDARLGPNGESRDVTRRLKKGLRGRSSSFPRFGAERR